MRLFILQNDASSGHDFTVLFGNFDVNKLMLQSIPAVPMPPSPPQPKPWAFTFFVLDSKFLPNVSDKDEKSEQNTLSSINNAAVFMDRTVKYSQLKHEQFSFQLMSPFLALL